MDGGYVLVHVLEATLPSQDLGDSPYCEITLGTSVVQCPIPTTLQSDNVALPTLGDTDPVIHVRAFDSQHRSIGFVVVPVMTLVALEVWNVWYAMDEDGGDGEEKPAEETPKMHLLLQYVPAEAATQESGALREMRGQDFLLRALQQLNASLEAKLVHTWSTSPSATLSQIGASLALPPASLTSCPPTPQVAATGGSAVSAMRSGISSAVGSPVMPARDTGAQVVEPSTETSTLSDVPVGGVAYLGGHSGSQPYERMLAAVEEKRRAQQQGQQRQQPQPPMPPPLQQQLQQLQRQQLQQQQQQIQQQPQQQPQQSPQQLQQTGVKEMVPSDASLLRPSPPQPVPTTQASAFSAAPSATVSEAPQADAELRSRLEAQARTILVLEERQRFFDDQENRIEMLAQSLKDQEQTNRTLHSQLQETNRKCQTEVEAEQENARQVHVAKANLEMRIAELQQEISLRTAHEDSLQKRAALMESELSVVHQKCLLLDSMEEEVSRNAKEAAAEKELRRQLQEQLKEQGRQLSRLQEEAWQLREGRGQELAQARSLVQAETTGSELLKKELKGCQDRLRDKEAECRLLGEKLTEMARQTTTLEAEVVACQAMLTREKQHRQELEARFEEQELQKVYSLLEEHRQTISGLREELSVAKQALTEEQGRACTLETHLAGAQHELVRTVRQVDDFRQQLAAREEAREELRLVRERNEELQAQMLTVRQDLRNMMEHHEIDIAEHSRAQQALCEERDERQREVSGLRLELVRAHQRAEEHRLAQEQTARTLSLARDAADHSEELQNQLEKSYKDVRNLHTKGQAKQKEFEKVVEQFQDEAAGKDQRAAELEKMLEDRNREIKLLMYRVQELSSKYMPARGDPVDVVLAKWVNGYRPAVPFFRIAPGQYLFGRRQVTCKISNEKPVFRVGGGFIGFDKFLELYASEELERLLSFDIDERTGEPRFVEAQKVRQAIEESGLLEDLRERVESSAPAPRPSRTGGPGGLQGLQGEVRRSLNPIRLAA